MTASKPWWASKTIWLGIVELAIGLLLVAVGSELTAGKLESALLMAAGILTVIMRFLTNRPITPLVSWHINGGSV